MPRREPLTETMVDTRLSEIRLPAGRIGPIEALEGLVPVLIDEQRFAQDVAQLGAHRASLVSRARMLTWTLQLACEWGERVLLSKIGCRIDLDRTLPEDERGLAESVNFMELLVTLAGFHDVLADIRATVIEVALLARQLRCETIVLDQVLQLSSWERLSPVDLIRLGEIDQACEEARWRVGAAREWERVSGQAPFATVAPVHLSPGRLDLLAGGETALLGAVVEQRMIQHVDGCDACRASFEVRRQRAALP